MNSVLVELLEVGLNSLNLLNSLLMSIQVLLAWLGCLVLGSRRSRCRGESAALRDEVGKHGLMLPALHGFHDGAGSLHQLGPAGPVMSLPGKNQRSSQHGIRVFSGEVADIALEALVGMAAKVVRHTRNLGALGDEGNVHGREGQQRVHDILGLGTNGDETAYCQMMSAKSMKQCKLTLGCNESTG